ncbi:hypothetical protein AB205_0009010, partial [Aquarana catesbeiana]
FIVWVFYIYNILQVPDQYGTIRAVAEGKADQFLVGTSRNFVLRGTFNDGFQVEVQGHTDELWGLATHPFKDLLLTCAQDKQVCLWNSVDHTLEWTRLLEEPGHCADFHPSGIVVAIGTHSGRWFVLDAETRDLVSIHTDGNEQLSVMRYSVGDIPSGCKLIRNRSDCKDIDWATYTCVLGFQVFGVWPEGSDGTDINALVRSRNRKVIALADDFCKVHLFQYPCSKPKAPSHKYSAHSSHVTNVSFTHSDGHLISTGGKDMSIMQWRVIEKVSLSQNDNIVEISSASLPAVSEKVAQESSPTSEIPPANEEDSTPVESPATPVEDAVEAEVEPDGIEEQNEVQSEVSSPEPLETNGQAPSSEINEEIAESPTITESQGEDSPVS